MGLGNQSESWKIINHNIKNLLELSINTPVLLDEVHNNTKPCFEVFLLLV